MTVKQYNIQQLESFYLKAADPERVEVAELVEPRYSEILKRYKKVVKTYKYASEEPVCVHSDKEKEVGEVNIERHDAIFLLAIDLKVALIDAWYKGQFKLRADHNNEYRAKVQDVKSGIITREEFQEYMQTRQDKRIDWSIEFKRRNR